MPGVNGREEAALRGPAQVKGPADNSNVIKHIQSVHPRLLMYEEVAARKLHPIDLVIPTSKALASSSAPSAF